MYATKSPMAYTVHSISYKMLSTSLRRVFVTGICGKARLAKILKKNNFYK